MRIMLDVALHSHSQPAARLEIAGRQHITPEHIAQLARHLSTAGLLTTQRGPGGGYRLGRPPDEIRLIDVFRALDESVSVAPCSPRDRGVDCERSAECTARLVWEKLSSLIENYLSTLTMHDLLQVDQQIHKNIAGESGDPLRWIETKLTPCSSMPEIASAS